MIKTAILIRNAASTDFGGGEKVPVYIAREAKKYNMNAIIFSSSKKLLNFAKKENVSSKKTLWLPFQNWAGFRVAFTPLYVVWQLFLMFYYLGFFLRYKPSMVHLQSKDDFIAGTIAARLYGARVLWSDYADLKHIWRNVTIWYKNPIGKIVLWSARFAEEIIVVSSEDLRLINSRISNGAIISKMNVVYNGAFDSKITPSDHESITFISTARLVTDKGINELIDAFGKLTSLYPSVKLLLVGDGPERAIFEEKSKSISNITFTGLVSDPVEYLSKSDIFVLPTYHEGFSLALVEACMQELAVITTNVGGNPEIIRNKENGLLVQAKDSSVLYDAMLSLLENPKLRKKLAHNARQTYVNKFDYEKIIKNEFISRYEK